MASKVGKSRSLNLRVSKSLVKRLEEEIRFLNLDVQTIQIEDETIKNKSAFLKWIVGRYAHGALNNLPNHEPIEMEDEGMENIPLYLDRTNEGLWNTAIRNKAAASYNQLAESALYYYFVSQDKTALRLSEKLNQLKEALVRAVPAELEAIAR